MAILRPATPGFICTLVATILLAVVSFCVPYFKSVYFLKANISQGGTSGSITFGTLGYCVELSGKTNCSKPSVGYELDINSLVGNKLPIEIPTVVVKWLTYALVLHIVALVLAAGSAAFGLLAHIREMAMTYCSTCISGFAATVALLAFIFDVALFFVARARINAVGSAEVGNALWLTLVAWILLFVSGCFYTLGRCCISKRKKRSDWDRRTGPDSGREHGQQLYAEQMRLDAVKAEADRKAAKNQKSEVGLPAFHETQPLTARIEGEHVYIEPYQDHSNPTTPGHPTQAGGYGRGGYVQAPPGSRAVDEYYSPTRANSTGYPPQPQRQGSGHGPAPSHYAPSVYAPSTYSAPHPATPPPPPNNYNQYLSPNQYPDPYGGTPSPGHEYGHTSGGTTYHSAASHLQNPSGYSQYDDPHQRETTYSDPYRVASPPMPQGYGSNATSYYSAPATTPGSQQPPERSYTLGGDGYGGNSVPPLANHHTQVGGNNYLSYGGMPGAIDTNLPVSPTRTSPLNGPRQPRSPTQYDDSPPGYEPGPAMHAPSGKS